LSAQAAQKMFAAGFTKVFHLQGGLPTWKAAGYPTKVNKNAPISMFRQVQIVAGSLVFLGTILGAFVSPWFLILSGFVGAGLVFAGVTNTCAMAILLAKLPYNQRAVNRGDMVL
jgi:rhodanese-related sulfurtransferase